MIPKYHACFVLTGPSLSSRTNFIQLLGPKFFIRFPYISIKTLQTKKEERSSNQPNQAPKSPPKHEKISTNSSFFPIFFVFPSWCWCIFCLWGVFRWIMKPLQLQHLKCVAASKRLDRFPVSGQIKHMLFSLNGETHHLAVFFCYFMQFNLIP